jgi:hypothetical protein
MSGRCTAGTSRPVGVERDFDPMRGACTPYLALVYVAWMSNGEAGTMGRLTQGSP